MIAVDARWQAKTLKDPDLWAPIETHLLPYLLRSTLSSQSVEQTNDQDSNRIEEDYQSLLHSFLSFLLAPDVRGNTIAPSILHTGVSRTDFALYDPNSLHHTVFSLPAATYAIPACLASSRFQRCMRVWVLEEMAEGGELPAAGRAGLGYLANQAVRFGGVAKSEVWDERLGKGVVIGKGRMATIKYGEWMLERAGKREALGKLNCPSGCWRLLEKGVLWGRGDVVADGKAVTAMKGQSV
jgi:hypothetical protein